MNITGYRLGVFLRAGYVIVPLAAIIAIPFTVWLLRPPPVCHTISPVVVLENGKPIRLACDAKDGQFRALAIMVAQDLAQAILGPGSNPVAYKEIVRTNAPRIQDGSEAASPFGLLTTSNLEKMGNQDVSFLVNSRETKTDVSKSGSEYYISLKGSQITRKAQAQDSRDVEFNVVLQFTPDRGKFDESVFRVLRFSERSPSANVAK
jgi:hypothetical protein